MLLSVLAFAMIVGSVVAMFTDHLPSSLVVDVGAALVAAVAWRGVDRRVLPRDTHFDR
jgi:hypothetical protein